MVPAVRVLMTFIAFSMAAAFDVARAPLAGAATSSKLLRRCLVPRSLPPSAELLSLRCAERLPRLEHSPKASPPRAGSRCCYLLQAIWCCAHFDDLYVAGVGKRNKQLCINDAHLYEVPPAPAINRVVALAFRTHGHYVWFMYTFSLLSPLL